MMRVINDEETACRRTPAGHRIRPNPGVSDQIRVTWSASQSVFGAGSDPPALRSAFGKGGYSSYQSDQSDSVKPVKKCGKETVNFLAIFDHQSNLVQPSPTKSNHPPPPRLRNPAKKTERGTSRPAAFPARSMFGDTGATRH